LEFIMKTLTKKKVKSRAPLSGAARAARIAAHRTVTETTVVAVSAASQEVSRAQDWRIGALLAHMAILLALLFVLREGVLTAYLIEHAVVLGAGLVLFVSPARLLGKALLLIGTIPGFLVLAFWLLLRVKCHG
jgi:hypothetical protein